MPNPDALVCDIYMLPLQQHNLIPYVYRGALINRATAQSVEHAVRQKSELKGTSTT